jgi:hypothetical protein
MAPVRKMYVAPRGDRHTLKKENYFRSEANTLARNKIIFEAKLTPSILKGHGNEKRLPVSRIRGVALERK